MMHQDPGKNLASPLFRNCLKSGGMNSLFQEFLWILYICNIIIESLSPMAVTATCDHNDNATFGKRCLCGSHSLDCLINVLIQRISAICGNGNVTVHLFHARQRAHKIAPLLVRFLHITRKGADDLMISV